MNNISDPSERTYYIAHTPATGVVHHGYVDPGQSLAANQAEFETFTDEALYAARLVELSRTLEAGQPDPVNPLA